MFELDKIITELKLDLDRLMLLIRERRNERIPAQQLKDEEAYFIKRWKAKSRRAFKDMSDDAIKLLLGIQYYYNFLKYLRPLKHLRELSWEREGLGKRKKPRTKRKTRKVPRVTADPISEVEDNDEPPWEA